MAASHGCVSRVATVRNKYLENDLFFWKSEKVREFWDFTLGKFGNDRGPGKVREMSGKLKIMD